MVDCATFIIFIGFLSNCIETLEIMDFPKRMYFLQLYQLTYVLGVIPKQKMIMMIIKAKIDYSLPTFQKLQDISCTLIKTN